MAQQVKHLGCIMDGNRRWARKQGLRAWLGHEKGVDAVKQTVSFCIEHNIAHLTLYAFSVENFKRSDQELTMLFSLLTKAIKQGADELVDQGVSVRFVGDRSLFPDSVVDDCNQLEQQTHGLNRLTLNILFCYGGQQEIFQAAYDIAQQVERGALQLAQLTPDYFEQQLWLGDTPKPDLIIRTGGEKRLSNFLLYQAAYAELFFLDCLWPDFSRSDLENVMHHFTNQKRNFGR